MMSTPLAEAPTVRLRLLGTVAATVDGRDIPLGGPRARAVVAALALARGRMLSGDALLRDVWGDATPGVRSALRANMSRLRATPLGDHLAGGRQGYALLPGRNLEVDLWLLDASTATPASLEEAAGWVDAIPLDGAGESPYLPGARAAVRALVRRAVTGAIDAHPRHPLAVVTAEQLLAYTPDDPELRALLLATSARNIGSDPRTVRGGSVRTPATAAATRLIGVPAPIAVYHPRPEEESRLAAGMRLSRLVTLVGPSGVGKSRLAIEWARGAGGVTQEHIWFCRAEGQGRSWRRELARAVGAADDSLDSITARMRALRGTIVIDGLDAGGDVAASDLSTLLEAAPGVAALTTSRRALGVPGESVHRVGALSVADARALFALRAGGEFSADQVDALNAALGRLPIAIELAAAQAAHLPLAAVLDALVPSAATGQDAAPSPLEKALAATVALLSGPQYEKLLRVCSFFGPFTRESAIALGGTHADLDVLRAWALVTDESRDALDLMRVPEVVRRRLGAKDADAFRARHTRWFAARTLAAFDESTTTEALGARGRLESERADIDAAFEWAIETGDRSSALSIAAGLSWWGLTSGAQAASLALMRRAHAVRGEARVDIEARARLGRGILSYQLGFMAEAEAALVDAVATSHRAGVADLEALSHAYLAYLATLAPRGTRAAIERMATAQAHLVDASPSARAMVTLIAAQVQRSRGDLTEALRLAGVARELAVSAGHGWVRFMSSVVAAKVRVDARDPRGAVAAIRRALDDQGVRSDPISVLIATSVAAGAAAGMQADAAGARIVGAVDAIGPRYGFDPRANEPADFDRYRRNVRQGLTPEAWRDAYATGAGMTLAELLEVATGLATRSASL